MTNEEAEVMRQRFDTFARTVSRDAQRINSAVLNGDRSDALRLSVYLVEEACLHIRRLNGIPDHFDDSNYEEEMREAERTAYDLATLQQEYADKPERETD